MTDWVLGQALGDFEIPVLIAGMADRLRQQGFSIDRIHVASHILHPLYHGAGVTWRQGHGAEAETYSRSSNNEDAWLSSPLNHMLVEQLTSFRLRVGQGEGCDRFPIIRQFRDEGVTDYLAILSAFGDPDTAHQREDGILMSWSTGDPAGWSPQDLADIAHLQSRFAVAFRIAVREILARDVVSAYLGPGAGKRVLAGQIARGDGEDIDAVIYFADLRASTRLAESLGRDRFVDLLNGFFECTALPVQEADGEILNYIGDSVLAIFPYDHFGGPEKACRVALETALVARERVALANRSPARRDLPEIGFGVGMHPGTVMFGNIGIPTRLAFSVIGSAVNIAARVTDKCRDLEEEILVSGAFRDCVGGTWSEQGHFELRNVNRPVTLYSPMS